MVPRAVLMKSGLVSINTARQNISKTAVSVNTARQVNTAHSKTTVNVARPMSYVSKTAHSTVKRPIHKNTTFKCSNINQKVNTVRGKNLNTAKPKAVVNVVKGNNLNDVKASACWVWKPKHKVLDHGNPQMDLQDQGVIDSGCSRYMTGNMSYLTNYEEIDGGYVAFGGNPKGGKITRKGTTKIGNLDFENVYFVRELKFNLFSVSQMCDKKNSVLFNDTECIVLSPNFKLIDESQVLLRVPRKNNMYSVDLKNIVPKGGLTCFFAKATSDESKLWHRRLGHLNFKTMNKLVKRNLVRGLPSKLFENDQTCVACQKGKQHRASCKSKIENSRFTLVFFLATKDETSGIENLYNREMYCLVVIDDYSRFTLVLFLATLVFFITGKFDGKADEGFFVGYSLNSKAFRVFNSRTRIVEENLHIRFSESTPNAVQKASDNVGQARKRQNCQGITICYHYRIDDHHILNIQRVLMMMDQNLHRDDRKRLMRDPRKDSKCKDQEKEDNVNSTNTVNASDINKVNAVDDEDDNAVADMNNLDTTIQVSPNPTTRIHKDHPLDQVIRDLQSATQTRKMLKNLEEHGKNPKKVIHALRDSKLDQKLCRKDSTIKVTRILWCIIWDVKMAFLYGKIEEEVPRAWNETMSTYLLINGFNKREILDKTLIHQQGIKLMMRIFDEFYAGTYILLGSTSEQKKDEIFISQDKYVDRYFKEILGYRSQDCSTPLETHKPYSWMKMDEAVHKELGDRMEKAATTASSLMQ
ncbi:putative ribonuclease H-like domain-containing protein [Tanacetum coccineum]